MCCRSDLYVVKAKVYLAIRGRTSNTEKYEEPYEKFMYPKYNLDSFQHASTEYLYKKTTRRKTDSKRGI